MVNSYLYFSKWLIAIAWSKPAVESTHFTGRKTESTKGIRIFLTIVPLNSCRTHVHFFSSGDQWNLGTKGPSLEISMATVVTNHCPGGLRSETNAVGEKKKNWKHWNFREVAAYLKESKYHVSRRTERKKHRQTEQKKLGTLWFFFCNHSAV